MPGFINTPDYPHGSASKTGILLTNLGTPDAPTARALRRYLSEFLSDPRVVEMPRLLWLLILHGVILNIRPARAAKSYQKVWMQKGSPLLVFSRQQARAIQTALDDKYPEQMCVALGMRYGKPAIARALQELREAGCQRLLVLPLYPQYSASTGASAFDAVASELKKLRWLPQFRMVMDYHQDEGWITAVADSIREHWQQHGRNQKLMMSFHGLPESFLHNGDPYFCQCHASARLIAEKLQLDESEWQLTFQSRFGRQEWLKPYCDKTLEEWAKDDVRSVDLVCPGFSADCLETMEEVAMQNRDIFLSAGGAHYSYIPALNDRPGHISALINIIEQNIHGWKLTKPEDEREAARQRAIAKGATR